jgi:hypothetical protein
MNTNKSMQKKISNSSAQSAEEHIRNQIENTPKLSKPVRIKVAQNMDGILTRAKDDGIKMHSIVKKMNLGSGEAKELYPFHMPLDGKEDRRLNTGGSGYLRVLEALASLKDHRKSGATSDLLREAFVGTEYWNRPEEGEDIVVDLHALFGECRKWLLRDGSVLQAFDRLKRLAGLKDEVSHSDDYVEKIYRAAFRYPRVFEFLDPEPPRIYLGVILNYVHDHKGREIPVENSNKKGRLANAREVYLYFGPDNDGELNFQVVIEYRLVLHFHGETDLKYADVNYRSDPFEITVGSSGNDNVQIPGEFLAEAVDLEMLIENGAEGYEFCAAFVESNPEIDELGLGRGAMGNERGVYLYPLTMDELDRLGPILNQTNGYKGAFSFLRDFGQPDLQVKYGVGSLAKLIAGLLYGSIPHEIATQTIKKAEEHNYLEVAVPPDGWADPKRHPFMWSMPDLLWAATRQFGRIIELGYHHETATGDKAYDSLMFKFKGESSSSD